MADMTPGEWLGAAIVTLLWILVILAIWWRTHTKHDRQPCVRCGRCCCTSCRDARRSAPWRPPAGGGYHACATAEQQRRWEQHPPRPPRGPGSGSGGRR